MVDIEQNDSLKLINKLFIGKKFNMLMHGVVVTLTIFDLLEVKEYDYNVMVAYKMSMFYSVDQYLTFKVIIGKQLFEKLPNLNESDLDVVYNDNLCGATINLKQVGTVCLETV